MKVYYYLYFRLYRFAKKVGTVDATWTAMMLISALLFLNIASIYLLFSEKDFDTKNAGILGGVLIFVIGIINYMIFIRHDNCLKIIRQFKNENRKQRKTSIFFTLIYVILTFFLSHYLI
jgi:hypothetical protein